MVAGPISHLRLYYNIMLCHVMLLFRVRNFCAPLGGSTIPMSTIIWFIMGFISQGCFLDVVLLLWCSKWMLVAMWVFTSSVPTASVASLVRHGLSLWALYMVLLLRMHDLFWLYYSLPSGLDISGMHHKTKPSGYVNLVCYSSWSQMNIPWQRCWMAIPQYRSQIVCLCIYLF